MCDPTDRIDTLTKGAIAVTGDDFVDILFRDERGLQTIPISVLYYWIVFKGGVDLYDPDVEVPIKDNYVKEESLGPFEKYYILAQENEYVYQAILNADINIIIEVRDPEVFDPFTTLIINVNGNCEKNYRTLVQVDQDLLMKYHRERLTPEIGMNKPLVLDRELIEILIANRIIEPAPTVSKVQMDGGILTEY